ncbi:MAG TPA: 5-(carboxyamino)imidazole ribonucleotide synthase [Actinomycetota bacterium]|nr:5-(carboxyamino)imidazole ribonucleotide synthase [Actinomycetota bacterium]
MTLVGIVGGGQLGMMLAEAATRVGIECLTLDPAPDSPASRVAPAIVGAYDDERALIELAAAADVVTYEFENVPVASARFLAERVDLFPPPESLEFAQDRVLEKTLFEEVGLGVAPFSPVSSKEELSEALDVIGVPSVLKTRRLGYDGKGQVRLASVEDAESAWRAVGEAPSILESLVPFERELSILGVRGRNGAAAFYPLVQNIHREGILRVSIAPAPDVSRELQATAERHALAVMERLGHVGVLAIELFRVGEELLANEMAPRVHNSGHWTIEGAATSQFENHLRAICGLELGSTSLPAYSAMVNLIGSVPPEGSFGLDPEINLHLYGKASRPSRKLGHVTIIAPDPITRDRVLGRVTRTADNHG